MSWTSSFLWRRPASKSGEEQRRIMDILAWKGEKPEIKKKLDSLKIKEEYYDPKTGTNYECIGKLTNGESITRSRSRNCENI